jgi:hypothetical protein
LSKYRLWEYDVYVTNGLVNEYHRVTSKKRKLSPMTLASMEVTGSQRESLGVLLFPIS